MSEKVPVPAEKVPAPASGAREPDLSWEGIVAAAKSAKDSPFATPGSVRVAVDTGNMTAVADHNTKETALWTKIKAAHRSCMGAAVATLRWAYVAGYLLSLAKLKTERGEWLPKLNAIGISSPTLNLYLTVYDNWSTLEGVDIPLREVKGYLAQPPDQRGQGRPVSEKQAEVSRLAKLVLEKGKDIVNDKGALAVA